MNKITISKTEYQRLIVQSNLYKQLAGKIAESLIEIPVEDVVEDFRSTNLYTKGFLRDLRDGLTNLRKS